MSIDTINGNDNTPQDHTEYWRSLTSQGFELIVKGQRVSSSSIQEIQGGMLRVKHTKACVFRADYNINPLQGGFWLVPRGRFVELVEHAKSPSGDEIPCSGRLSAWGL
jgi:hypothetical protein